MSFFSTTAGAAGLDTFISKLNIYRQFCQLFFEHVPFRSHLKTIDFLIILGEGKGKKGRNTLIHERINKRTLHKNFFYSTGCFKKDATITRNFNDLDKIS